MALPAGVTTVPVIAGVPVTHTGAAVKAFVSIEPSAFLVHAATGTPLVDFLEELDISEGTSGQFILPHTDQAGFEDGAGNAYTNWYYTARITYSTPSKAKTKAPKVKVFQLLSGQTDPVDLDKLPEGAPALPYSAPTAKVDAFMGRTGAVTLEETDLPARLSETELSATYGPTAAPMRAAFARSDSLAKGMICFVWDDGFASHDTVSAMATDRGQRHTFGVVSTFMNGTNPSYARPSSVLSWFNAGHEIVSHSATHANMAASTLAARMAEYDDSKAALEAVIGVGNIKTFMYPYGGSARNLTTDKELYLRYDRVLSTGPYIPVRWDTPERENEFIIHRFTWDGGANNQTELLAKIRQCADQPMILVTTGHDLGAVSSPTQAQVAEALDLAQSLGIPCVPVSQAFPRSSRLINAGFETANGTTPIGWGYNGSDANQLMQSVADTPAAGMPGSRSLYLKTLTDTSFVYARQPVELKAGVFYKVTGKYRVAIASGTGSCVVRVQEHDYDELGALTGNSNTLALTSTTWADFTLQFTSNQSTRMGYLDILLNNVTGEAWFDHIDIRPNRNGAFG